MRSSRLSFQKMLDVFWKDIALAKALCARPSSAHDVAMKHGVDIILGGHDHFYYVSKGCQRWEGYDINASDPLGAEDDDGVLVVKSGTDFRELSEITLELEDGPPGATRKRVVKSVVGSLCPVLRVFGFTASFRS